MRRLMQSLVAMRLRTGCLAGVVKGAAVIPKSKVLWKTGPNAAAKAA